MEIDPSLSLMSIAFIGGLFINYLDFVSDYRKKSPSERIEYFDKLYIAHFVISPIIGSFITILCVLDGQQISHLLAAIIGITGTSILQRLREIVVPFSITNE